ncbi:hypothetical protein [Dyadobacter sp. BHUBP1]|uniref:glycosyl-4,4'-diaponeurosporenoate acyltransferase CrtO family protein n=1 Tax=Dyadobacter sp. BHUBP1 TaxID=3424178 RepID=UPI003D32574C
MLIKRVKILVIVCLAVVTTGLMLRYMDITSAAFSFGLNFAMMFWVSILEPQLKPALDSPYFDSFPFEKEGKLYRMLGVEWYRAILTKSGWEKLRQKATPIRKSLTDFQAYERAGRVAEVGHLAAGVVVLIITGYVAVTYSVRGAIWLIVFNVFLNFYPVLLQRYTRPRLLRIIEKLQKGLLVTN